MHIIGSLLALISVPLILLNSLGFIIAGIWLAFLGEWGIIGSGILSIISASFFLSILILPVLLFAGLAAICIQKNKILGFIASLPAVFYTNALITLWCVGSFFWVENTVESDAFIPGLLWAYGIATGPWAFFASKEQNNEFSVITVIVSQIACMLLMLALLIFRLTFWNALVIVGTLMGAMAILQSLYVFILTISKKEENISLNSLDFA